MGINIKRQDVVADIQALANVKGLSMTEVVGDAVRKELEWTLRRKNLARDVRRITERMAPLLKDCPASWEIDDLLYDELGLPK